MRNGKTDGEPWRFYDLGHAYCTYDFFDQRPHRMTAFEDGENAFERLFPQLTDVPTPAGPTPGSSKVDSFRSSRQRKGRSDARGVG